MPIVPEDDVQQDEPATKPSASTAELYQRVVQEQESQERNAIKQSMAVASTQDPDRWAKVVDLSRRYKMPTFFVDRNFDEISKYDSGLGDPEIDKIIRESPKTASWLSDPSRAAITHDRIENLVKLERKYKRLTGGRRPLTDAEKDESGDIVAEDDLRKFKERQAAGFLGDPLQGLSDEELRKSYKEAYLSRLNSSEAFIAEEGKIGFWERVGRTFRDNNLFYVPFLADAVDVYNAADVYAAAKAVESNSATPAQKVFLRDYGRIALTEAERGNDFFGTTASILTGLPAFVGTFAATGGAYSGIKGSAEIFIRKAVTKVMQGKVLTLGKAATRAVETGGFIPAAIAQTALSSPLRIAGDTIERMTPGFVVDRDQRGEIQTIITAPGEGIVPSVLKASGASFVEVGSERTGILLERMVSPLKAAVMSRWLKKNPDAGIAGFLSKVKSATGWNGVIGEIFEERVGEVGRAALGIEEYHPPTLEQLAAEAFAFSIPGAGAFALNKAFGRRPIEPANVEPIKAISEFIRDSKLGERDPMAAQAVVQNMVEGTDAEFVQIDKEKFDAHFQTVKDEGGKPLNPREVWAEAMGETETYDQSVKDPGIKLVIPMSVFAVTFANTEHAAVFEKYGTTSPSQVTEEEAPEEEKLRAKVVEGMPIAIPRGLLPEAVAATEGAEAKVEAPEAPRGAPEGAPAAEAAPKAPAGQPQTLASKLKKAIVRGGEPIRKALKALGLGKRIEGLKGITAENIDQMTEIVVRAVTQLSAVEGITPEEFAKKYNIIPEIAETPELPEGGFEQAVTEAVAPEAVELSTVEGERAVSTRFPTAKRRTEDPTAVRLSSDVPSMRLDRKLFDKNVKLLRKYPNYRPPAGAETPEEHAEAFISQAVKNLLFLYDAMPEEIRERARRWYEGAKVIVTRWSEKYDLTQEQVAGVIAVLSPQKDWFENVSLAERVLDIVTAQQDAPWDDEMEVKASEIFPTTKPVYRKIRAAIKGKRLSELTSAIHKAAWVRVYDQAKNPQRFSIVTPEGEFSDVVLTNDGAEAKIRWQGLSAITKAVLMIENPDISVVSRTLGEYHKVRNFYNNIINPFDLSGDVTVDTHAVGAANLRPLTSATPEAGQLVPKISIPVHHAFGSRGGVGNSSITGIQGTYAVYVEAYRRAADARGILPREMQSVTWESVRGFFQPSFKTEDSLALVDAVWNNYANGRITQRTAQRQISEISRGFKPPEWAGSPPRLDGERRGSSYTGELLGSGAARWREGAGRGAGGATAAAVQGPAGTTRAFGRPVVKAAAGPDAATVRAARTFFQTVFHGSPMAPFSEFSLQRIGEGQGEQAYGWGLYFAELKAIAKFYRDNTAILRREEDQPGTLFTVEIPENEDFINWDQPLSKQSGKVKKIISEIMKEFPDTPLPDPYGKEAGAYFGDEVYWVVGNQLGKDGEVGRPGFASRQELASRYLATKGIAGIRYLDQISRKEGRGATHNFVVFDDKLIKILETSVPMQFLINLSTATETIAPVKALLEASRAGDAQSTEFLQELAKNGLIHLIEGIESATVKTTPTEGLYFGSQEPSLGVTMSFESTDLKKVLAALERFGTAFNQEQVHVRERAKRGADVGYVYEDGSYNTLTYRFLLDEPIRRSIVESVIKGSGLAGLTVSDEYLEVYYVGNPNDAAAIREFVVSAEAAGRALAGSIHGVEEKVQRLRIYGQGSGAIPYGQIRGDVRLVKAKDSTVLPALRKQLAQIGRGRVFGQPAPEEPAPEGLVARRGFTQQLDNRIRVAFTKKANFSTWLHEIGHVWLIMSGGVYKTLKAIPATQLTPQQTAFLVRSEALLEFFGVKDFDSITMEHHELFAETVETYFAKGMAPSSLLRKAFRQFVKWMLDIYGALRGTLEIDPRVSNFLDRLLASEAEIAQARRHQEMMGPIAQTASQVLGDKAAQEFLEVQEAAHEAGLEELVPKAVESIVRERTKEYAEELEAAKEEITLEVNRQKEYVADSIVKFGTLPNGKPVKEALGGLKLSRQLVADQYGEAVVRLLEKFNPDVFAEKGGVTADHAAEVIGRGFTSGDQLVRALIDLKDKDALIEERAKQRLAEAFGDIFEEGELSEEAMKVVHNKHSAKLMRLEAQMIASEEFRVFKKLAGRVFGSVKKDADYEKAARDFIAGRTRRNTDPRLFLRAEQKAGRDAIAAFGEGRWKDAFDAKIRQLENHEKYRAALEAVEKADATAKKLRKTNGPLQREKLGKAGKQYLEQYDSLMEQFDFKARPEAYEKERESRREWIERVREETGLEPVIPNWLKDDAGKKNYKDITFAKLEEVRVAIESIIHQAKLKNKLLSSKTKREYEEAVEDMVKSILENASGARKRSLEPEGAAFRAIKGYFALHRKFASLAREMDGWKDGGALWEHLVRGMNKAGDSEVSMNAAAAEALGKIFNIYSNTERFKMQLSKKFIPELQDSLTKQRLLMLALNFGNLDSRGKLLDGLAVTLGRPITEEVLRSVLDRELDKRDWEFVQNIWNHIDTYWEETKALSERVDGLAPEKVEAAPIKTRFGEVKGGYFPLKYDPSQSQGASETDVKEQAKRMMYGAIIRSTTKHGHREERVGTSHRPVRLDFGVIFEHVAEVIHDQTHYEYLIDANRLLRSDRLQTAIRQNYGDHVLREMKAMLEDVASGGVHGENALERGLNYLRRGTTTAILGFKVTTALVQPLGITQSIVRVGGKWIAKGLGRWIGDAVRMESTAKLITEKSEMMRNRFRTFNREINEIRNQLRGTFGFLSKYQAAALWMTAKAQMIADIPTWLGAYEKAMAEGKLASSAEETKELEARAVDLADQAVLDSQGGGQIKDLARISRLNAWAKLFTMFSNYYISRWNLTREAVGRAKLTPDGVLMLGMDLLLLYPAPVILGFMIKMALRGGDDDEEWGDRLIAEMVADPFNNFIVAREVPSSIQHGGFRGPAGTRFIEALSDTLIQTGQAVEEGETDDAFWRSLRESAGIYFHLPAGQVESAIRGFRAVDEGSAGPGSILIGPPPRNR